MCGIVGYIGPKKVFPLLIGGLEKLEYRGYDSAGVARIDKGRFTIFRSEGKLSNLKLKLSTAGESAESCGCPDGVQIGIGHTRWATHGRPSEVNAHPHIAGRICVVHNGIVENYLALRERLSQHGAKFSSDTDTEIAAHLINYHYDRGISLIDAVRAATAELEGSYALVVISSDEPDRIVVAKNATPVVAGTTENEAFIASDIPAILEHTRTMHILEDGEIAEIKAGEIHIYRGEDKVEREPVTITWDPITAEKGGYRHFMLKEIYEQPQVITDTFRGRIDHGKAKIHLEDLKLTDGELRSLKRICIVGCGTAWHAALVMKFYIERFARINVEVDYSSEFRYREPVIDQDTLFIAVSQSGETADTLSSLQLASDLGARTLAICNVVGSSISRKAESIVYTHAGPEISVASTKAFVTQVVAGYLLALKLASARETLSSEELSERIEDLVLLPNHVTRVLECDKQVAKIARKYGRKEDFLFLGRGILYPIALEGALKLKEISYVHAEGYPSGEMKHGPIALISEETPVVMVFGQDGVNLEKATSNMMEVESRGGQIIAVTDRGSNSLSDLAWEVVSAGEVSRYMLPVVLTVPLQLFAYHVAVYRGTDVDQPRNLAKSVTVE
ncbi:MAG: glutamine--fructose-6-phosphate transaminase (isomerizing) [bacterium]|nr:glutamine--fructose-6-phosphate transaminase (isomerizing) [bacterium]